MIILHMCVTVYPLLSLWISNTLLDGYETKKNSWIQMYVFWFT